MVIGKNNVFSENTTGFRKCRSCLDSLRSLVTRLQIGFSRGTSTAVCFLDIDNAYNNVDKSTLVSILDRLRIGGRICKYLWNILQVRHLKITLDNASMSRSTCWGLV